MPGRGGLPLLCMRGVITTEEQEMELDDVKAAIKNLSAEERRKVALYILDLERQHLQGTIGPQLTEDLDAFTRVVQDTVDRIKRRVKENLDNL
jgi:hypothetical protein